ncbi:DUF6397 family protein [Streptomyces sp. NBC_00708]
MATMKVPAGTAFGVESRAEEVTGSATVRDDVAPAVAPSRAATELGLKRREFDLAVHLGAVRVRSGPDGRPRVHREEMDRLRARDGFPDELRALVRTVGTAEGARLLGISPVRFTRLARAGCLTPVAFYLNRYRAVVWVYLAREVEALAVRSPELLVGNSPPWMRDRLESGGDWRPRNWRSRRIERLLALTEDPWLRVAVVAQSLDPVQLAEVVDDPYERAHFARVGREAESGRRGSVAGREAMARLMHADEPDEILWRRISLIAELDAARELRPAPRPGETRWPEPVGAPAVPAASARLSGPPGAQPPSGPGKTSPAEESQSPVAPPAPAHRTSPGASAGLLARLRLGAARGLGLRRPRHRAAVRRTRPRRGGPDKGW